MKQITREYNYSDVYLVPNKCIVNSRSECDTGITFGGRKFDLPVIPANMPSVIDESTCEYLIKQNICYVMHRINVNQLRFVDRMQKQGLIASISVGVNEESYTQLRELKEAKLYPEMILIDIAYGFSPKMQKMLGYCRDNFPTSFIWAGNVGTPEGVEFLTECGARAARIFIGPGAGCDTSTFTGFKSSCISTILGCSSVAKIPLVPDGGVRQISDISKAICAAGMPSMISVGSLFAGYMQSAGDIVEIDDKKYKHYFGNASEKAKQHTDHIEGKAILVDYKGCMTPFLKLIKQSLQSSISYAGGTNLSALANCRMVAIN